MPSIIGTNVSDELHGSNSKDTVLGFDGDDVAEGRGGDDTLDGGFGNDTLFGGAGNDTLIDRFGFNWLYGGGGNDFIGVNDGSRHLDGGGAGSVIYGDGFNSFILIAGQVQGGSNTASTQLGDDTIYGTAGADIIFGDNGDPTNFSAAGGNDSIFAGNGADFIDGEGGNDLVYGEEGDDTLFGGEGKDTVAGGMGDDVLTGGRGADLIDGGVGYDRIIYNTTSDSTGNKIDTIFNFESAVNYAAGDKIDISALVGPSGETIRWTDRAPSALGAWVVPTNDGLLLLVDATGDVSADLRVAVFGAASLKHSDILGVVNHAPFLIEGGTIDSAPVTEAGAGSFGNNEASGSIVTAYTDADGDVLAIKDFSEMHQGLYGSLHILEDGRWTYVLDNTRLATDQLTVGQQVSETFEFVVTDGLLDGPSVQLNIPIIGADDVSVITGDIFGFASQLAFPPFSHPGIPATGDLYAEDVDGPDDSFQVVATPSSSAEGYGVYTVTASGQWTYTLDNTNPEVQGLAQGEFTTDTFTVYSQDGAAQTVLMTISGADDDPRVAYPGPQTMFEDTPLVFSAQNGNQILVSDPDSEILDVFIGPYMFFLNPSFTLSSTAGLTFTTGNGVADHQMSFRGSVEDINAALDGLIFMADPNFSGPGGIIIRAFDSTAGAGGSSPNPDIFVTVTWINDAPSGYDMTVSVNEDVAYTFTPNHFAFADAESTFFSGGAVNSLAGVKITTLPLVGTLTLNGQAVTEGQLIGRADLNTGSLKYLAEPNANGLNYASFSFQVQDNGGTAFGGLDLDPTPNLMKINVNSINDAPQGIDATVVTNEDTAYVFRVSDFGLSDPHDSPPNGFSGVKITTLPAAGTLELLGTPVAAGDIVSAGSILSSGFVFRPGIDQSGESYASFMFQVLDNGGTATSTPTYTDTAGFVDGGSSPNPVLLDPIPSGEPTSGVNLDPTANKITIDVLADIVGTEEYDELIGTSAADKIFGLGGDDLLIGGQGADTMTGGEGSDTFRFHEHGGADRITDFAVAVPEVGGDVLDIRELLAAIQAAPEALADHVFASFFGFSGGPLSTVIGFDPDGIGGPELAEPVVTLAGVMVHLQTLIDNGQIFA